MSLLHPRLQDSTLHVDRPPGGEPPHQTVAPRASQGVRSGKLIVHFEGNDEGLGCDGWMVWEDHQVWVPEAELSEAGCIDPVLLWRT